METEFEITFPNIDKKDLRGRLRDIDSECIKERTLMKRCVFDNPEKEKSFLRLRDEGNKVTCTFKELLEGKLSINSVKEMECQIDDLDTMKKILKKMGIEQKAYQETYREVWKKDDVYFMIDEWPGLKPFVEIEGESEETVKDYVDKLGFDYENGLFGAVDEVYLQERDMPKDYINNLDVITFDNPPEYKDGSS